MRAYTANHFTVYKCILCELVWLKFDTIDTTHAENAWHMPVVHWCKATCSRGKEDDTDAKENFCHIVLTNLSKRQAYFQGPWLRRRHRTQQYPARSCVKRTSLINRTRNQVCTWLSWNNHMDTPRTMHVIILEQPWVNWKIINSRYLSHYL